MKSISGAALLVLLLLPQHVSAHPLDEFGNVNVYDQKQTLVFTPQKTILTIDLTLYPMEKIKVWESIDVNRDQVLSEEEKEYWMKKGQESSWMERAGQHINFEAVAVEFPDYYDFFATKPSRVSIMFESTPSVTPGHVEYVYQGKDKKLGEIEFAAKGEKGLRVDTLEKISADRVKFTLASGEEGGAVLGTTSNNRLNSFLNKYVKVEDLPARLTVFALAVSFVLGALHALTPGHGKAIVASYLVGSKGTVWHALNLGLIVTITHTASVFLLGLASVWLTAVFVPSNVIKTLNIVSGLSVLLFGLYLVVKRGQRVLLHQHDHYHEHDVGHKHHHDGAINWKNLVPLGVSGGIVPCVDALAILIVAVSLGKIVLGLLLLTAFSVGLAAALVAIGVIAVLAQDQLQRRVRNMIHIEQYVSLASAGIVTLLGLGILLNFGI